MWEANTQRCPYQEARILRSGPWSLAIMLDAQIAKQFSHILLVERGKTSSEPDNIQWQEAGKGIKPVTLGFYETRSLLLLSLPLVVPSMSSSLCFHNFASSINLSLSFRLIFLTHSNYSGLLSASQIHHCLLYFRDLYACCSLCQEYYSYAVIFIPSLANSCSSLASQPKCHFLSRLCFSHFSCSKLYFPEMATIVHSSHPTCSSYGMMLTLLCQAVGLFPHLELERTFVTALRKWQK